MPLILNIDTAVQTPSVCLANTGQVLGEAVNPTDREAAAWLHPAITRLMADCGYALNQLDAIAISAGPGSYTGLRVGMAAAKGLCYALELPLIAINTLQMMAAAAPATNGVLLCPMIDARRMEVFTAIYNNELVEVMPTHNLVLDEHSFQDQLEQNRILFFGNGSVKTKPIINHSNALFVDVLATAKNLAGLSQESYHHSRFVDVAYTEPFYAKEFHSPLPKKKY